jgi:ABC-2 type transport system permease protein
MNKNLKKGGIVAIFTVIVIAAVIVVNLIAGTVPAKYRRLDLSTNQIFSLSDTTKDLLGGLTKDVNIYIVGDPDRIDERITHFAGLYADLSDHVTVEVKDPVLHPDVLSTLNTEANTVLVSCPDTGKTQSIPFTDIIQIDLMAYYQYQQYKESSFDGEGQLTSAISYVANDTETNVYQLSGHKESTLPAMVTDALKKSNMQVHDLNLLTEGAIPGDCELLLINNPQTDLAVDEKDMIAGYLKQGGHVLILTGYTESGNPNLSSLCADYGHGAGTILQQQSVSLLPGVRVFRWHADRNHQQGSGPAVKSLGYDRLGESARRTDRIPVSDHHGQRYFRGSGHPGADPRNLCAGSHRHGAGRNFRKFPGRHGLPGSGPVPGR